jgi:anti-anti-sigma factor
VIVHRGGETVVERRGEAPCTELCRFESIEQPYGVRLVGEIDASNVGRLDDVLAALSPAVDVHVDMTRLEYIDLRGLLTLVRAAGRQTPPARLVLVEPHPIVRHVLEVCEWSDAPGLAVTSAGSAS